MIRRVSRERCKSLYLEQVDISQTAFQYRLAPSCNQRDCSLRVFVTKGGQWGETDGEVFIVCQAHAGHLIFT